MRRRLYLIILLAAVTLSGFAQNVGDAFYIYRNDGHHEGFLRNEVISIDYSNEDADGNTYNEIVTQVITTADSIYKIPLALIDSISFVQPKTIYQDDVTVIDGNLHQYLIKFEDNTLFFRTNTPSSILPKVGNKLALMERTDILPNGFLGKVTSVSNQSGAIAVKCESIELLEAVKQYHNVGIVNIVSSSSSPQLQAPRKTDVGMTMTLPPINGNIQMGTGEEIQPQKDLILSVGANAGFEATPTMTLKGVVMIDNEVGGYVNIVNITDWAYHWTCHYAGGFQLGKDFSFFGHALEYPIVPPLNFYVDAGVIATLTGTLCWEAEGDAQYRFVSQTVFDLVTLSKKTTYNLRKIKDEPSTNVLAGELEAKLGIYGEFGFSLICTDLLKAGARAEFGVKADASLSADLNDWQNASTTTDFYESMLANDHCVSIGFFAGVKLLYDFASGASHGEIGFDWEGTKPFFSGNIVPTFSDVKCNWSGSDANASMNISKPILIPTGVGFSAFDKDNNKVETIYDPEKYSLPTKKNDCHLTFSNLRSTKKYQVYPTLKIFDRDVLATPSTELEEGLIEVKTLDVHDITETSATLFGELSDFDPAMEGKVQFYCGTNSVPQTSAMFDVSQASGLSGASFSKTISNLKRSTNYYYAAVYNKGGELSYGEIKHFRTKGDMVSTGIATDIDTNSAVLHGNVDAPDATEVGIIYAENSNIDYNNGQRVTATVSGTGDFQISVSGLEEGKTYYFRAYVVGYDGTKYGEVKTFQTTNGNQSSDILYVSDVRRVIRNRQDGGNLLFGFAVTMTGQHESLTSASEYGYYVFNGSSYSYHPVTLGIGGTVEDQLEFSVNRYDFTIRRNFYADIDYYKIGAYIKQGGEVQLLNEQKLEQIDYDVAPNITYTSATVNYVNFVEEKHAMKQCWGDWYVNSDGYQSRSGEMMECKRRIYKVSRSFKILVEGTFWIEEVRFYSWRTNSETYTCYTADFDWWNEAVSDWRVLDYNGEWSFNGMSGNATTTWYPVDKPEPDIYITECCEIKLINGWMGQSSNMVRYTISSGEGSVTVGPSGGEITFPVEWNIDKYY